MKRRGFFGLIGKVAGAFAVSPLVAKDMGDFEYRDTPSFPAVPEVSEDISQIPVGHTPTSPIDGQIHYNTTLSSLEVYVNNKWITVVT